MGKLMVAQLARIKTCVKRAMALGRSQVGIAEARLSKRPDCCADLSRPTEG